MRVFLFPRLLAPVSIALVLNACGGGSSGFSEGREPARLLLSDSFEGGSINPAWHLIPLDTNYAPRTQAKVSVEQPRLSGSALQYHVLKGQNEVSPITLHAEPPQFAAIVGTETTDEIYFEWNEFFESSYPFPSSSQKLLRFGFDNPESPMSRKELGVLIQDSNGDVNVQYFCGAWGDNSLCNVDQAIHSSRPMPTNRWVKLGIWARLNTPGESDGFIRLFMDGNILLAEDGIDMRGDDTRGYNYMWLGGNYSMLTGGRSRGTGSRYIDEVRWYSTFPG